MASAMDSVKKHSILSHWFVVRPLVMVVYIAMFALSYWFAYGFRFDFDTDNPGWNRIYGTIGWVLAIKTAVFFYHRHFHCCGLYATFKDGKAIVKSSIFASAAVLIFLNFFTQIPIPRSIIFQDCVITICLIGMVRMSWRLIRQEIVSRFTWQHRRRVLIIGANHDGLLLAQDIADHPELEYKVVGFLSVHEWKIGQQIGQIPVVGLIGEMESVIRRHSIQDVLILPGILTGDLVRNVMDQCQKQKVRLRIIPAIETQLGNASIPMRDIRIEDLLKRAPVKLDDSIIENMLSEKTVLVTGAGGSIGSEICRQIIRFGPEKLLILGRGENRIFFLEQELKRSGFAGTLIPLICDVTNEWRMEQIFQKYRPENIFHAAAHKHVPLMESNVGEAIINNIKGTKIVSDLANKFSASTFVLVSTDKAVNPTSVMGATKHLAERYVHSLAGRSKTKFIVTRFGNVLGSAGSVVPIFKKQIAAGGPITITDRRMTRYFMTIPEASQLVLQASAMGIGGEIFVLDMGEPVRILDLAKDMIRLSGLSENAIEIRETGMRPGEKLYEELYFESEKAIRTSHPKLRCASHRRFEWHLVESQLVKLFEMVRSPDTVIRTELQNLISEYQPELHSVPFQPVLAIFPEADEKLPKTG
ncbi:MAG: polysaccharide biosynthesis protein [Thermoguttaceae bacterium]